MSGTASAGSLRVLVVEDEALVAMLLEDMMDAGHQVARVLSDFEAAIDYVTDQPQAFDVAVLDVNLAGRPSFPIADALNAAGKPLVFSTGYGRDGLPEAWQDRPVLAKPFGADAVITALQILAEPRD